MGIYQTWVNRWDENKRGDKPYPNMVVYFDEVNQGKSRKRLLLNI